MGLRALDIVEKINDTRSIEELDKVAYDFALTLGMSGVYFAYYHPLTGIRGFDHRPKEWTDHYQASKLFAFDPVHRANFSEREHFTWEQCYNADQSLTPQQMLFLREANDVGLADGINIKHADSEYSGSVICFYTNHLRSFGESLRSETRGLTMVAAAVHSRFKLLSGPQPDTPKLTPRELQCLSWASEGKSNADIATILNISDNTVNTHIQNAARKLGTYNKLQAIVKAVQLKIVVPHHMMSL